MTKEQALEIVIATACNWGENAEEDLPLGRRLSAGDMSDDEILAKIPAGAGDYDYDTAIEVRDLWRAVALLSAEVK